MAAMGRSLTGCRGFLRGGMPRGGDLKPRGRVYRTFSGMPSAMPFGSFSLPVFAALLLALPLPAARAQSAPPSARQVIERLQQGLGGTWGGAGVDAFKDGDPETPVRGIAVSVMATMDVLQRAVAAGANFIVTHEPTFYGHLDRLEALEGARDAVTAAKRAYIREHGLVVYRLHDHVHAPARPRDPFIEGVLALTGWAPNPDPMAQMVVRVPPTTLEALARQVARVTGAATPRVVGNRRQPVRTVAILPGAAGFDKHRAALARDEVDALIVGEPREWETVLYADDAVAQGRAKGLVVLGHIPSEAVGSEAVMRWLREAAPGVPVVRVEARDPFWRP